MADAGAVTRRWQQVHGARGRAWAAAILLATCYLATLITAWVTSVQRGYAGFTYYPSPQGSLIIAATFQGGPADRAGIVPGDMLLARNGGSGRLDRDFLQQMASLRPGDRVTLRVEHTSGLSTGESSEVEDVQIVLGTALDSPDVIRRLMSSSVIGLLSLAVGVGVVLARPGDRAATLLLLVASCIAFGLAALVWASASDEPLLWQIHFTSVVLGCAAALHLFLIFPEPHPLLSHRWPSGRAVFGLRPTTLCLYLVVLTVALMLIGLTPNAVTGRHVYLLAWPLLAAAVLALLRSYRNPRSALARAQLQWILWGLSVGMGGLLIGQLVPVLTADRVRLLPLDAQIVLWACFPLAVGFAVLRYRLFDVNLVLRATLVYPIVTATLLAGYLAAGVVFGWLANLIIGPSAVPQPVQSGLAALTVTAIANPVRGRVQGALDHLFYRHRLAREHFLQEAGEAFSRAQPVETVAVFLTERAIQQLELTGAWVAFGRDAQGGFDGHEWPAAPARPEPLIQQLRAADEPVVLYAPGVALANHGAAVLGDDQDAAAWYAAGARLLIPLRTSSQSGKAIFGLWALGGRRSGELFDREDLSALARVGDQAAVLFDYARLHRDQLQQELLRHDLARAAAIQRQLLPPLLPGWPHWLEIAARFRPAGQTSGDFYDLFPLGATATASAMTPDGQLVPIQIAVGDVAGKGIAAALVMAVARTALRAVAQPHVPRMAEPVPAWVEPPARSREVLPDELPQRSFPSETLRGVSAVLHRDVGVRSFVACALAVIDPPTDHRRGSEGPRLRLANAGQVAPLLCHGGQARELEPSGERLPLGVLPQPQYGELEIELQPGDAVVFASDGLPEAPAQASRVADDGTDALDGPGAPVARHSGELFGFERLAASAAYWAARTMDAESLIGGVWTDVTNWSGESSHHDDMTLLVLRVPRADHLTPLWTDADLC